MYGNYVNPTVLWKALLLEVEEQEEDFFYHNLRETSLFKINNDGFIK
jgi:hypothetical protein